MKRFLPMLLMLLLAFQSTWAVASVYCSHEQGAAVQHFGHHAHQHQVGDKDKAGGGPSATFHADCGFCHLGGVGVASSALALPSLAAAALIVPTDSDLILSVFDEGPERPKWASAA